jgi:hypothetical protein
MSRVQRLRDKVGLTDKKLIATGVPARGRVVEARPTSVVIGIARKFHVCEVDVDVELDGERYRATCTHPIAVNEIDAFKTGDQVVVVKVNPDDRADIALDFAADAPPKPKKGLLRR